MSTSALILEPRVPAKTSVIWLHGLGADGHDFAPLIPELKLPKDHAIRFIFPHAPVRPITFNQGYPMRGWYDIVSLKREEFVHDLEGIRESVHQIEAMILTEKAQGIEKIIVTGFSQGGAVALFLGMTTDIELDGLLVLSSYLPAPEEMPRLISKTNLMTPILMMHGTDDLIIAAADAAHSYEIVKSLGFNIDFKTYPMAHTVCPPQVKVMSEWLQRI